MVSVLHLVYNLIRGGTEGQCARAAMGLAARGWPQAVGVFRREGFFLDALERVCGPVREVSIRRTLSLHTVREVFRLSTFIRVRGFRVVHAWDADAAIFGGMAARLAGVQLITSRRDLGHIYARRKLLLMQRADRRAAAVVINAEAIRDVLRSEGLPPDRVVKIPNMLDVPEFDRAAAQPFSKALMLPKGQLLVSVARLDPEKDVASLIAAMPFLAARHPDLRLVIAGDGPERARLDQLARDLGVQNSVVFLGEVHEIPALLCHARFGALVPKSNEGLPNAILEYMAARIPFVATDCGGNAELAADGRHGIIVPPGNPRRIAEALEVLLADPVRTAAMGEAGRHAVETNHRPETVLDALVSLYSRVAEAKS